MLLIIAIIATVENKVPLVIYTSEIFSVFLLLTPCHPLAVLPILFTEASRICIIKKQKTLLLTTTHTLALQRMPSSSL